MMSYIKVRWIHSFADEPVWIYSEIDTQGNEIRKVELFSDGRFGFASQDLEVGGSRLAEPPIPSVEEIAEDPQFRPERIAAEEFKRIWERAVDAN